MAQAPKIDFEKLKKPHWSKQEVANVKIVVDFIQTLMNDHDFEAVLTKHSGGPYVQHNRAIPDGMDGLVGYVKNNVKRFPDFSYDVKDIVASDDRVIFHSHVTMRAGHRGNENKGFIIYDEWRLENGQIADHWDAIQPIDFFSRLLSLFIGGRKGNSNSLF